MKRLSEKESLDFLEKGGISVVPRKFFLTRFGLKGALRDVGRESVMKVSGKSLPSEKEKLVMELKTYSGALEDFRRLKKIHPLKGIILKKKVKGKEFFVEIRRNENKKYSLLFSFLGTEDGQEKILVSKSFPINKKKLKKMIKESKFPKTISKRALKNFEEFVFDFCQIVKKGSKIEKIQIDPLFVNEKFSVVVSASVILD